MYYKFIDEKNIEAFENNHITVNGRTYANPTAENLLAAGYKPLVYGTLPENNLGTEFSEEYYIDGEESISIGYRTTNEQNESV